MGRSLLPSDTLVGSCDENVSKLAIIPGEKVSIPARRHHSLVFDFNLGNIDEPGLKFFEVEMNVDKVLAILAWFGYHKLKHLLVPAFAYPANIGIFDGVHAGCLPTENNVIAVDIGVHNRV